MTTVETFSTALVEAHRTGRRADASKLPEPDYDQALEIQRRVKAHLGPVAGFKVARRSDGPPVIAPIRANRTLASGTPVAVRDRIGIELEIGFELISEPAADMVTNPATFFLPRIVLELVDTRLDGAEDAPMMKLADMQINDGLIVGPRLMAWDGSDFGEVTASLRCGETQVIDGVGTVPGGSAIANLALFLAHIEDHCGGLTKGQIVITGSISGLAYFPGGTDIKGRVEGFGAVNCRLA